MDIHIWISIWISIYGFPGIPGGDPWIPWGVRWDLGTDGNFGPMGPGPQGPPILPPRILPPSCLSIPGPAGPARPGRPGRPGPVLAAGPGARCPAPGPAIFRT